MSSPSTGQSTTANRIDRAGVMDRYYRMKKKRMSSAANGTPNAETTAAHSSADLVSDENRPTFSSVSSKLKVSTPSSRPSTAFPLSPKNGSAVSKSRPVKSTPPLPQRKREQHAAPTMAAFGGRTEQESSPMAAAPPATPSSSRSIRRRSASPSASARRERLARHAKILGNRGRTSATTPTPRNTALVSTGAGGPDTPTTAAAADRKEATACIAKTPASKSLPPMTPSTQHASNRNSTSKIISTGDDHTSRLVRERRARGAKKLFILATSPSADDDDDGEDNHDGTTGTLTPLERHLNSHDNNHASSAAADDGQSVYSDVSTITMSTLSSLARDRRARRSFSRERKYSASRLYARATGSVGPSSSVCSSGEERTTIVDRGGGTPPIQRRGRSPVRAGDIGRGTPQIRNTTTSDKYGGLPSPSTNSTTSASDSPSSSAIGRRAVSIQKAKRLARSRSASRGRARSSSVRGTKETTSPAAPSSSSSAVSKAKTRSSSVGRRLYASPVPSFSSHLSGTNTPASSDSRSVVSSMSGRSRAASVERARKTLARTKPRGNPRSSAVLAHLPKEVDGGTRPLSAREKLEAQARRLSFAPQTRQNLDKRTARLKFHEEFSAEIAKCREEMGKPRPKHFDGENLLRRAEHGVSIFIRKRPIFDYEEEAGDFDVVFTEGRNDCDAVVIHSCTMHADMKKMFVKPIAFPCSAAFDDTCTNDMLYTHVGRPLVRLAVNGGLATLLMYGQTGSGKTHTITGMEERVCKDLFRMLTKSMQVKVQFVEIAGKKCQDLLGDGNVMIVDQEKGSALLLDACCIEADSAEALYNIILQGKKNRATESTDKNDSSSRSHAVCQITITSAKNPQQRGFLTLIDCAGSERRNDSLYHSRERQKESTEINESLWALKECIRARASGNSTTGSLYRSNPLTRILRGPLERDDAQLCVIATVAPTASDTEHSMETLKTVSRLVIKENPIEEMKTRNVTVTKETIPEIFPPKQWDRSRLIEWMGSKRFFIRGEIPEHADGKHVMRMNRIQLKNMFFGDDDDGKETDRLYNALRTESDRANRAQRERRIALSNSRAYDKHEI